MYNAKFLGNKIKEKSLGHVLDLATGQGDFLHFCISNSLHYLSAIGVDIVSESLYKAKKRYPDYLFLKENAEKLSFLDESFHTVLLSNAIHHFSNTPAVLKECYRVLKPGGMFVVRELIHISKEECATYNHQLFHEIKATIDQYCGIYHRFAYTQTELEALLKNRFFLKEWSRVETEKKRIQSKRDLEIKLFYLKQRAQYHKLYNLLNKIEDLMVKIDAFGYQYPPSYLYIGTKR